MLRHQLLLELWRGAILHQEPLGEAEGDHEIEVGREFALPQVLPLLGCIRKEAFRTSEGRETVKIYAKDIQRL